MLRPAKRLSRATLRRNMCLASASMWAQKARQMTSRKLLRCGSEPLRAMLQKHSTVSAYCTSLVREASPSILRQQLASTPQLLRKAIRSLNAILLIAIFKARVFHETMQRHCCGPAVPRTKASRSLSFFLAPFTFWARGTPVDLRAAASWFALSAAQGNEISKEQLLELAVKGVPEAVAAARRLGLAP